MKTATILVLLLAIGVLGACGTDESSNESDEPAAAQQADQTEATSNDGEAKEADEEAKKAREERQRVRMATKELKSLGAWDDYEIQKIEANLHKGVTVHTLAYPNEENERVAVGICTTLLNPAATDLNLDVVMVTGFDGKDVKEIKADQCWADFWP